MEYKFERRARKLDSRKKRMKKHGKNIGEIYVNAITKRERKKGGRKMT